MNSEESRVLLPRNAAKLTAASILVAFLTLSTAGSVWSQDNPLPATIKDVKTGASSASVVEKIKAQGTHAVEPIPEQKRQKLTWVLPDDPYYENLQFQFTEKDRLYQIRFSLKKELWRDSRKLKKAFLDTFQISPDDPLRLRVKNQDILVYAAAGGDCDMLDFTEASTGEKWFVLVNKAISIADRTGTSTQKKDEKKSENKSN